MIFLNFSEKLHIWNREPFRHFCFIDLLGNLILFKYFFVDKLFILSIITLKIKFKG